MKIIVIALASLLALVLIVVLIGALLPRRHEVSRSVVIAAPPAAVYGAVTDVANAAAWRPGVQRVEVLGRTNGRLRFREHGAHGAVFFEVFASDDPTAGGERLAGNTGLVVIGVQTGSVQIRGDLTGQWLTATSTRQEFDAKAGASALTTSEMSNAVLVERK